MSARVVGGAGDLGAAPDGRRIVTQCKRYGIRLFDNTAHAAWAARTGPAPWM
ncbi:hypothetical protein [Streptomyces sp. UG1]|uniref:hypothetical protein n=1 Tax=Streptomyces sp. UG1 TaxID=3417652 RepID=UPI003CEB972A